MANAAKEISKPLTQTERDADTIFAMLRLVGAASTERLYQASCMPRMRLLDALRESGAKKTAAELWVLPEEDMHGAPGY